MTEFLMPWFLVQIFDTISLVDICALLREGFDDLYCKYNFSFVS